MLLRKTWLSCKNGSPDPHPVRGESLVEIHGYPLTCASQDALVLGREPLGYRSLPPGGVILLREALHGKNLLKKTNILFFLTLLFWVGMGVNQASAQSSITIKESKITVKNLLREITRQSQADFTFNPKAVDLDREISFSVEKASLTQTLDKLTKKLQLSYRLIGGQIILKASDEPNPPPPPVETINLSGFVSDQSSGENMIGSTVFVKGTSIGTFTNEFGYYVLSLKPGSYTIIYSHLGYQRIALNVTILKNTRKDIALSPTSFELPAVVIGPSMDDILNKRQLGQMELSPTDLSRLPEFAGEPGIVNGMQSLPGIKTHGDGSAYFYTRGGERDQNIIFIDDAPIFNPSHMFGFYSIFVPDFAKSVRVYKSDMPAMMGDRLSSIISIRTRDGNLNKFQLSGAVNPFVNRLSFETPIRKEKSSAFVSLRRSNFDWIYRRQSPGLDINFSDFHFKWNRKINENNRLFFTTIWSQDLLQNVAGGTRTGITWANFAATLRWNRIHNPKLFSNTIIYTGTYGNRLFLTPNFWKSGIGLLSIKTDFTHFSSEKVQSKFGFEIQGYFNDPGTISLDTTIAILPSLKPNYARKTVLYYQGDWTIKERLKLKAGVRLVNWSNLGPATYYRFTSQYQVRDTVDAGEGIYNSYFNADPRVSLQYRLDPSSQIKVSYGRYHQYLQMISNSISPFTPLEVWLPASPNIKPQVSQQWSVSYLKFFEESKTEISAAIYHKKMKNQIDYEGHAQTYVNPLIEGELRFGTTTAYGLEILLKKDLGKLSGWMAYNYSRVFRQTQDLNGGEIYPAFQDRPHDFSLLLNYQAKKRVLYSAYWTSYSGSPFTSPTGFLNFNNQTVPVFGERNNDRLPAYHRLDLSAQFRLNKNEEQRYKHNLTVSVNNFLAHKNVFALKFNRIQGIDLRPSVPSNFFSEENLRTTEVFLIRFFPSVTYRFSL
jgi:hypothetical protein